jgi:hypothetical protein
MPSSYCSTSPGEISISDGEVDGTDYLLSSTIKLDDNFNFFQILDAVAVRAPSIVPKLARIASAE